MRRVVLKMAIFTVGLAILVSGCGPAEVVKNPIGWPEEMLGRKFFNTPNAYIYASSEAAAGEADRFVIKSAEEFRKYSDSEATKVFVIVTDKGDKPLLNLENIIDMQLRKEAAKEGKTEIDEQKRAEMRDELKAASEKLDFPIDLMLSVKPFVLGSELFGEAVPLPAGLAEATDVFVALPTAALIKDVMSNVMSAALKTEDVPLTGKALLMAMMPLINKKLGEKAAIQNLAFLLTSRVNASRALSAEKKQQIIDQYAKDHPDASDGNMALKHWGKRIGVYSGGSRR